MATKKISALTELTTPAGTEELIVNAGGTSKKITQTNLLSTALPKAGGTMTGTIADFTSTGIDDNATSTAITIDASEDVLIGQTTSNFATTGIRLRSSAGQMTATRSGGAPLAVNRLTSDGAILDFNSAGTNVGSVSVTGTGTTYSTGSTGGIDFSATSDGSGTMTSEVLDDYEEGTWTPAYSSSGANVTYTAATGGNYTKVGRLVSVNWQVNFATVVATGTGGISISGLPFTNSGGGRFVIQSQLVNIDTTHTQILTYPSGTSLVLLGEKDNSNWGSIIPTEYTVNGSSILAGTATYITDA